MATAMVLTPTAPPVVVGPGNTNIIRPTKPLPRSLVEGARVIEKTVFNPSKHIKYQPPKNILSMKELGFEGAGISPNAVSEPFSLFTEEAIKQMRAELFSQPVLENHRYASNFATNMIRGFGPSLAPFIFDAWHSPEVLDIVSKIAGVELVPALDYEVGHINISIEDQCSTVNTTENPTDDGMSAFAWHHDSYPFVCVTMLSDCTGMIGGETAIRTGNGEIRKVRGPTMGTAVVMQGRYIEHQALRAYGGRERISMVTAFRPKSALLKDETVLTGVRPISDKAELYRQYTSYRLEVLEERLRAQLQKLRTGERARPEFDLSDTKRFLDEQKQFLEAMLTELV